MKLKKKTKMENIDDTERCFRKKKIGPYNRQDSQIGQENKREDTYYHYNHRCYLIG